MLPSVRQSQIIQWLSEQHSLTIDDLTARLSVSTMTIHRDLDALVRDGLVVKVHGGVTLNQHRAHPGGQICALCHAGVNDRSAFIIQVQEGDPLTACCPHCGFLLLQEFSTPVSVLVRDFLYGRTMNAGQAVYVVDSSVHTCCVPGVLCFATRKDAERFQKGFEGDVMDFAAAQAHLSAHHHDLHSHFGTG